MPKNSMARPSTPHRLRVGSVIDPIPLGKSQVRLALEAPPVFEPNNRASQARTMSRANVSPADMHPASIRQATGLGNSVLFLPTLALCVHGEPKVADIGSESCGSGRAELATPHLDNAPGSFRRVRFVCDHQDRAAALVKL